MSDRASELAEEILSVLQYGCGAGYCTCRGKTNGMHVNRGCRCKSGLAQMCLEFAVELESIDGILINPPLFDKE